MNSRTAVKSSEEKPLEGSEQGGAMILFTCFYKVPLATVEWIEMGVRYGVGRSRNEANDNLSAWYNSSDFVQDGSG